jgi:hypothetical protein
MHRPARTCLSWASYFLDHRACKYELAKIASSRSRLYGAPIKLYPYPLQPLLRKVPLSARLEFDENGQINKGLILAQIWEPNTVDSASTGRFGRPEKGLA